MKPSEHELILKEVARCIFRSDWAIYEENGNRHVSGVCFLSDSIKGIVMHLVKQYVTEAAVGSVVGYSEGIDESAITIASEIGYVLSKPIFTHVAGKEDPSSPDIGGKTCSIILPYTSFAQQVKDIVEVLERRGGGIKQVIVLVDEKQEAEDVIVKKDILFQRLLRLQEICNTLQTFMVPNKAVLDRKIAMLCS